MADKQSCEVYDGGMVANGVKATLHKGETVLSAKDSERYIGLGKETAETSGRIGRSLSINVDVDVSEALTGLKAIQREAKKATQALRELEAAQRDVSKTIFIPPFQTHPNTPVVAPLTVGEVVKPVEVPEHVKNYGKHGRTYTSKSTTQAWFKGGDDVE